MTFGSDEQSQRAETVQGGDEPEDKSEVEATAVNGVPRSPATTMELPLETSTQRRTRFHRECDFTLADTVDRRQHIAASLSS